MMSETIRKHFIFRGEVQGVGFRYRAYYEANRRGVSGWVRNLYDGTVEMEAQGEADVIDALVWALDQGRLIRIEGIDSQEKSVDKKETDFRILN
ncbi:MAG: acylphosphatase [Eubacterium sp.]|nr:acylphosphatase [Eubacterium sp.]